jgi:hypothetical protein
MKIETLNLFSVEMSWHRLTDQSNLANQTRAALVTLLQVKPTNRRIEELLNGALVALKQYQKTNSFVN